MTETDAIEKLCDERHEGINQKMIKLEEKSIAQDKSINELKECVTRLTVIVETLASRPVVVPFWQTKTGHNVIMILMILLVIIVGAAVGKESLPAVLDVLGK